MERGFFLYLGQVSSFIAILPLLYSLFAYERYSLVQKRLVYLLLVMFLVEMGSNLLWQALINNNPLFHFYAVIEFLLISSIYATTLSERIDKKYFSVLEVAIVCLAIVNVIWFQPLSDFNSNITAITGFLVIIFAMIYFYDLLRQPELKKLDKEPMFWISVGVLIYFSTNQTLFFINQNVELMLTDRYTIWGMHAVVNIVLVLMYFIALWIRKKEV